MPFSFLAREAGRVHVCGHRGYSLRYPENTLPAFQAAKDWGATTVEVDVMLTADGEPIVLHDRTGDRTTDGQGFAASRGHVWRVVLPRCEEASPAIGRSRQSQAPGPSGPGGRRQACLEMLAQPGMPICCPIAVLTLSRSSEGSFARRATGPTNGRGGRGRGIMSKQNLGAAVLAGVALLAWSGTASAADSTDPIKITLNDWTGQFITTAHGRGAEEGRQHVELVQADYLSQFAGLERAI